MSINNNKENIDLTKFYDKNYNKIVAIKAPITMNLSKICEINIDFSGITNENINDKNIYFGNNNFGYITNGNDSIILQNTINSYLMTYLLKINDKNFEITKNNKKCKKFNFLYNMIIEDNFERCGYINLLKMNKSVKFILEKYGAITEKDINWLLGNCIYLLITTIRKHNEDWIEDSILGNIFGYIDYINFNKESSNIKKITEEVIKKALLKGKYKQIQVLIECASFKELDKNQNIFQNKKLPLIGKISARCVDGMTLPYSWWMYSEFNGKNKKYADYIGLIHVLAHDIVEYKRDTRNNDLHNCCISIEYDTGCYGRTISLALFIIGLKQLVNLEYAEVCGVYSGYSSVACSLNFPRYKHYLIPLDDILNTNNKCYNCICDKQKSIEILNELMERYDLKGDSKKLIDYYDINNIKNTYINVLNDLKYIYNELITKFNIKINNITCDIDFIEYISDSLYNKMETPIKALLEYSTPEKIAHGLISSFVYIKNVNNKKDSKAYYK